MHSKNVAARIITAANYTPQSLKALSSQLAKWKLFPLFEQKLATKKLATSHYQFRLITLSTTTHTAARFNNLSLWVNKIALTNIGALISSDHASTWKCRIHHTHGTRPTANSRRQCDAQALHAHYEQARVIEFLRCGGLWP